MKKLLLFSSALIFLLASCSEDVDFASPGLSEDGFDISSGTITSGEAGNAEEGINEIVENPFIETSNEAISTFSIDADGASYAFLRNNMANGQAPNAAIIRTEELVNYFNYDYVTNLDGHPLGLEGEVSHCPWNTDHKLVRIGIKGNEISKENYPPSNLVFLIDVSGSMRSENKLELLKRGFIRFVDELRPEDRISIVTYASNPGVTLESTSGSEKDHIINAIRELGAGGSTNGEGGIIQAYEIAEANFIEGGNNRIIMGTDGDFNVGISSQEELVNLIEEKRENGVFLSVLGVGISQYAEGRLEQIANHGNGSFEYLDNDAELDKVFVNEFNKFFTVAKDVKVQVEFNADHVAAYRLIGYENRVLATEDFEDDTVDAGEIGAGQSITALYEIVPRPNTQRGQRAFTIDFRYKLPDSDSSIPLSLDIVDEGKTFEQASNDHRFAAAVASFGLLVRDSEYKGDTSFDDIIDWADNARTYDPFGYKLLFLDIVRQAEQF